MLTSGVYQTPIVNIKLGEKTICAVSMTVINVNS
jgi:hypothetical protein